MIPVPTVRVCTMAIVLRRRVHAHVQPVHAVAGGAGQIGPVPVRAETAALTCCHRQAAAGGDVVRTKSARCAYCTAALTGRGATSNASPPRFSKVTAGARGALRKCCAKVARSATTPASVGLLTNTHSNSRSSVALVSGGVSQQHARKGSAASALVQYQENASLWLQRSRTSAMAARLPPAIKLAWTVESDSELH